MIKFISHTTITEFYNASYHTSIYVKKGNDYMSFRCEYGKKILSSYKRKINDGNYHIFESQQYRGNIPYLPKDNDYLEVLKIFKVIMRKYKLDNLNEKHKKHIR